MTRWREAPRIVAEILLECDKRWSWPRVLEARITARTIPDRFTMLLCARILFRTQNTLSDPPGSGFWAYEWDLERTFWEVIWKRLK